MATGTHTHSSLALAKGRLNGSDTQDGTDWPFYRDPSYEAGAGLAGPAFLAATPIQTLYLTEPGTTGPISVTDIHQGQLGDCFLLSPIGEEARFHPSTIMNMIHDMATEPRP